jgi:hypothetical protein
MLLQRIRLPTAGAGDQGEESGEAAPDTSRYGGTFCYKYKNCPEKIITQKNTKYRFLAITISDLGEEK